MNARPLLQGEKRAMASEKSTLWYVADPMCSWCWGFSPVIEAIQKEYSDRLGISLLMGGLRPRTLEPMDAALREEILHHWREVHRRTGQPFQFEGAMPKGFVYDTEPACRAVVAVSGLNPALAFPYFKAVQRAFYAERQDVTQTPVLSGLAVGQGLEVEAFLQAFQSEGVRRKTEAHFAQTHEWGVRGFPTVLLKKASGGLLLTRGYQPMTALRPGLEEWITT